MRKYSIVVLNWNGKAHLAECLSSLRSQSYMEFETILVDNGSTDDSVEFVRREFPEVRIIALRENLGFSGGNNVGIRDALARGAEYVLLLNNDTFVAKNFLAELIDVMERNEKTAVVCPKIYFAQRPQLIWYAGGDFSLWTGFPRQRGYKHENGDQFDRVSQITLATGCAMLVRASAIEAVGFLDERFWAYYEDVEWSVRFLKKGYKIYFAPASWVWHKDGASFTKSGTQALRQYLSTRNLLFLGWKHARGWQIPSYLMGVLLTHILFFSALRLARADYKAFWAIYRGVGAFLNSVVRDPAWRGSTRRKHAESPPPCPELNKH